MFTTINTKDHASLSPAVKDGFSKDPIPRPFVFLPAFPFVCNPLIRCLFCGAAKTLYHIKIPNIQKRKFICRDKQRGPYRSYTRGEKNHVVSLHNNGMSFATISKKLRIPQKNIVRWCK